MVNCWYVNDKVAPSSDCPVKNVLPSVHEHHEQKEQNEQNQVQANPRPCSEDCVKSARNLVRNHCAQKLNRASKHCCYAPCAFSCPRISCLKQGVPADHLSDSLVKSPDIEDYRQREFVIAQLVMAPPSTAKGMLKQPWT